MKRVLAALLLFAGPVNAQVSSTAAPVANSSGSVTNQAVQVVPSKTFASVINGVQCQGATLHINPFLSSTTGWSDPYERYYNEPVYDTIDLVGGGFDPEGNPIPDGRPDNPGNILFHKPVRTGQKTNFSINGGITAQISIPLDRSHIRTCRRAAEKQVELMEAALADKRLNYELARLKTCSELMKGGAMFHPRSPYSKICSDVILVNPPGVLPPHTHLIPTSSKTAETSDVAKQTQQGSSSPASP
nr:gp165 [uncultured Mediterranean phage uvMED]